MTIHNAACDSDEDDCDGGDDEYGGYAALWQPILFCSSNDDIEVNSTWSPVLL